MSESQWQQTFSAPVRRWLAESFAAPTPAQQEAWAAIAAGEHTLVCAPTGSGKTLAAFLSAIDRLLTEPAPIPARRCRVLYISPLKALAVDVQRNLRSPLVGIRRIDPTLPDLAVAVRSGDSTAAQRRTFATHGADILITTPESLYLLLTSQAREMLRGVDTVIVDEIHTMVATKRGAHLALSLERLDVLAAQPTQRIGLSATAGPPEEVGRFLTGHRPVQLVVPPTGKQLDLSVIVPVPDMTQLDDGTTDLSGHAAAAIPAKSMWPHVEQRIAAEIAAHRSTIVFVNSRRLAERLTARLNEIATDTPLAPATPAQVIAQSGHTAGAAPVLARAHHGSVAKHVREEIESDLKSGVLKAVVATASLELGIDMGAVDLVIHVAAPPTVAAGMQRVGRAGHQVGAPSKGLIFPTFRGDLLAAAVTAELMRDGRSEDLAVIRQPLDVLAQQIVAIVAMDELTVDELHTLVRRSAPYAQLGRAALESVLDMLAGRYPSEEFAELRPRLNYQRASGLLTARAGAQRLAVTSGGTIPDRGLFGVFLAGGDGPGRRVGELDEEMVYESRVGDVFALGTSSWQIVDITRDQVLVQPAPGAAARLPFWKGDGPGRPAELGRRIGNFTAELTAHPATAPARLREVGLDDNAAQNLMDYLAAQRAATGVVPDAKTIVVERFHDEVGDWRVVVHSPYGSRVHAPWALLLGARLREEHGLDAKVMYADDGIVLTLPDLGADSSALAGIAIPDLLAVSAEGLDAHVAAQLGGSAAFAARFRECAARALLLPRRNLTARQPLWQQRLRSAALFEVAAKYPEFPVVAEAARECLSDVFDVPALAEVLHHIDSRQIRILEVCTAVPSPFAAALLLGYVANFLYDGDLPLAERRAASLSVDPALLAELLGSGEQISLRDLLSPDVITETEAQLQRLPAAYHARSADDIADLVRVLGPLSRDQCALRWAGAADVTDQLGHLVGQGRLIEVRLVGIVCYADPADAGLLRDGLGVALPPGIPAPFTEPVADPLRRIIGRYARCRGPFTVDQAAAAFGLGRAVVEDVLGQLVADGRLRRGEFRPGGSGVEYLDAGVLQLLRRRSLAALRAEVEPVTGQVLARFLPDWQQVQPVARSAPGLPAGDDGGTRWARLGDSHSLAQLRRAIEQLAGHQLPASALETLVLPVRVAGYQPSMLDELMYAGEVSWTCQGAIGRDDAWVYLHPPELAPVTLGVSADTPTGELAAALLDQLTGGGGYYFSELVAALGADHDPAQVRETLWELIFAGLVRGDTLAALRARLDGGRRAHRAQPRPPRLRYSSLSRRTRPQQPADVTGRFSAVRGEPLTPTDLGYTRAELLLDRYGVITAGMAADLPGGFAGMYPVLAAMEEAGRIRRGYFVEHLGAAQFGTSGAVDRLRSLAATAPVALTATAPAGARAAAEPLVLAATDPANAFGNALPWPDIPDMAPGHRPARRAGALVVIAAGRCLLYAERGGRSLLVFEPTELATAAAAVVALVRQGGIGTFTVRRINGTSLDQTPAHLIDPLRECGFALTPSGLRLRQGVR